VGQPHEEIIGMIKLTSLAPGRINTQTLIIPVCPDRDIHRSPVLRELTRQARRIETYKGDKGEDLALHHLPEIKARRVLFMGLGHHDDVTLEQLRQAAGKGVRLAQHAAEGDAVLVVPDGGFDERFDRKDVLAAMAEGALLSNGRPKLYKSEQKIKPLKSLRLLTDAAMARRSKAALKRIEAVCRGTLQARDWINQPANEKTPDRLARRMAQAARRHGVTATILDEKKLQTLKMGALLAVGAGSAHPPRMLILEYRPPKARGTIALIGKGVTFDAGGLNMKPTGSIELMKIDMAGAAAVAAAVIATAETGANQRIVGVIPLAENMVSGRAFRPGDIVHAFNGRTIEIGNTDAEGRLILADAMAYAAKTYRPRIMIDMATLTGACVVALGQNIAGLFSPDDELRNWIERAGSDTHERCWPMPLPEDYQELLKSDLADMRNIGPDRWGGAIVAALFLSEFAAETRWAHIDIAGPAYHKKGSAYGKPGATGFGVRLLCRTIALLQSTKI
jgi:leucyl aminopeptidase